MRRTIVLALVLFIAGSAYAAKRRSVAPGGRCSPGGLISFFVNATVLALDDTHVYYFDDLSGTFQRAPKAEQLPSFSGEVLAELEFNDVVTNMTMDATHIFFTAYEAPTSIPSTFPPNKLYSLPKSGGTPALLASNLLFPRTLQTDATHVYWADLGTISFSTGIASDGKIERVAKDGTGRLTLAGDLSAPFGIVLDGDGVIFIETGLAEDDPSLGLRRVAKSGGTVTDVRDNAIALGLEIAGDDLYFVGEDMTSDVFGLLRMPKSGGTPVVLFQDEAIAGKPYYYDGQLYYVTENEDEERFLWAISASGGTPRLLSTDYVDPETLAIDECYVYYLGFGNVLYVRR